jgi:protein-glutamine gamma-glutamyltransferase
MNMTMSPESKRRWIILLMVVIEAATLALTYRVQIIPVVAVGLALLGVGGRMVFHPTRRQHSLLMLVMLMPFVAEWQFFPFFSPHAYGMTGYRVTYVFVQYFMSLQIMQMFIKLRRPSAAVPLIGAVAMACAGNVFVGLRTDRMFGALCLVFSVLIVLYLRSMLRPMRPRQRRAAPALMVILLAISALAASAFASALYWNRHTLQSLLIRPFAGAGLASHAQFSDEAVLGSVNQLRLSANRDQTALRVFSDRAPGYLRAKIFDTYQPSLWLDTSGADVLKPVTTPRPGLPQAGPVQNLFELIPTTSPRWTRLVVWPTASVTTGMFIPKETAVVAAPISSLRRDTNGAVDSGEIEGGVNYVAHVPEALPRRTLSGEQRKLYTALPLEIHRRVRALSRMLFAQATTRREKIDAVVRYFRKNYTYHYGIQLPEGVDPVTYFLLARPAAHCEYFAAGTALLLRLGGVPTRYVTGFVAEEWNPLGKYWMARYRSAHAWVEAWDDKAGRWEIVEATPSNGVPSPAVAGMHDYMIDLAKFRMQEAQVGFQLRGVVGFLHWARDRIVGLIEIAVAGGIWSVALLTVLALLLARFLWRRLSRIRRVRRRPTTPEVRELHALLRRADRALHKLGLRRGPDETLLQFARRVQPRSSDLADWYAAYAVVRYRGEIDSADIDRLRTTLA